MIWYFKEWIQLNFTSSSQTCLTVWSRYISNSDKSDGPPPNPSGVSSACGDSGAWVGDTCLIRKDEGGNAWSPLVDAPASTGLEAISVYDDRVISLWTNTCCTILLCLNLSRLSAIMSINKPHKHYTYEIQWDQTKKCIPINLINFRDVSSDSKNQNIGKFQMHLRKILQLISTLMAEM